VITKLYQTHVRPFLRRNTIWLKHKTHYFFRPRISFLLSYSCSSSKIIMTIPDQKDACNLNLSKSDGDKLFLATTASQKISDESCKKWYSTSRSQDITTLSCRAVMLLYVGFLYLETKGVAFIHNFSFHLLCMYNVFSEIPWSGRYFFNCSC
jgi:hypothetical protein